MATIKMTAADIALATPCTVATARKYMKITLGVELAKGKGNATTISKTEANIVIKAIKAAQAKNQPKAKEKKAYEKKVAKKVAKKAAPTKAKA